MEIASSRHCVRYSCDLSRTTTFPQRPSHRHCPPGQHHAVMISAIQSSRVFESKGGALPICRLCDIERILVGVCVPQVPITPPTRVSDGRLTKQIFAACNGMLNESPTLVTPQSEFPWNPSTLGHCFVPVTGIKISSTNEDGAQEDSIALNTCVS